MYKIVTITPYFNIARHGSLLECLLPITCTWEIILLFSTSSRKKNLLRFFWVQNQYPKIIAVAITASLYIGREHQVNNFQLRKRDYPLISIIYSNITCRYQEKNTDFFQRLPRINAAEGIWKVPYLQL